MQSFEVVFSTKEYRMVQCLFGRRAFLRVDSVVSTKHVRSPDTRTSRRQDPKMCKVCRGWKGRHQVTSASNTYQLSQGTMRSVISEKQRSHVYPKTRALMCNTPRNWKQSINISQDKPRSGEPLGVVDALYNVEDKLIESSMYKKGLSLGPLNGRRNCLR